MTVLGQQQQQQQQQQHDQKAVSSESGELTLIFSSIKTIDNIII